MFEPRYPNLELLEYQARQILREDPYFLQKYEEVKKAKRYASLYLNAIVFPQVWGSTCLGIDRMPDGSAAIGGCAMTKAYTTVFHDASISDTYIVFFGGDIAYKVTNADPASRFIKDLRSHNLAPLSIALKAY